jgi:hypothetical protein
MGNIYSNNIVGNIYSNSIVGNIYSNRIVREKPNCLICWDEVDHIELIQCIRCNIHLHTYCEETYRGGKGYCKCPHCQQIGTLGATNDVLNYRNKEA